LATTAIIGLGVTGFSCLQYLHGKTDLLVVDTRKRPPNGDRAMRMFPGVEFQFGIEHFEPVGVDRIVVSPGVDIDGCLLRPAREQGISLSSDIDLFCAAVSAPVIAITGTNGKSTVTALAGHLIAGAGLDVGVGGNLGEPALDLLRPGRDCYVLELSSFQLERLDIWPFAAACILNVSEDHIDRHGSLAHYAATKQRIFRRCELALVNRGDPRTVPEHPVRQMVSFGLDVPSVGDWGVSDGWLVRGGDSGLVRIVRLRELPLVGTHNQLNSLAACALARSAGVGDAALAEGMRSFVGLPHRCQRIADVAGVAYVDDSKATNVGATVAALQGLGDPNAKNLVLIAGGDGKGADFAPLQRSVDRFVKALVLLGKDAPRLAQALDSPIPRVRVQSMREAVVQAQALAESGDTVLLSPACASLDMFENFVDRGLQFAGAVAEVVQ